MLLIDQNQVDQNQVNRSWVKKSRVFKYSAVLLLVVALAGCNIYIKFTKSKYIDEMENNKSILVYGYFDDTDAPYDMEYGEIKQFRPATDEPYHELRSNKNKLFYLENLPVGSYKLMSVNGSEKGISTHPWETSFPDPSNKPEFKRVQVKAKKSGLYYLGSYKLKLIRSGGFFGIDKFEFQVLKNPSEKKVLKKLLKYAKGTKWSKLIRKRIKQLK